MDYRESVEYLKECARLGSRPGLETVCELLRRLGNPQDDLRFIHVAGTNGKGSVASFAASILSASGYRTGFFASPWVYRLTETICINGQEISEEALAECISRVRPHADSMPADGFSHPTEFEILTATSYVYFAEEACDCVVVEAGMGGRLDATNAIARTVVSVLTKIDYDHQGFLGDTLADITREKCGILKNKVPVVSYPLQEEEVLKEITEQAKRGGNALYQPSLSQLTIHAESMAGSEFSFKAYQHLKISLCGKHQIYNAITAVEAVEALREQDFVCTPEQIRQGLLQTVWHGRFEVLSQEPPVILDGAHNVNGAKACTDTLRALQPNTDFIVVIGMLRDKDYEACLTLFSGFSSKFIITEVPSPRAERAEALAEMARSTGAAVLIEKNPEEAVYRAFSERAPRQGILCVGSLYALSAYKKACLCMLEEKKIGVGTK